MNDYIVIPCQLIRDNNLTNTELFLLMEINQLSMLEYGCIAKNEHFATKFNLKKESVSRSLNELKNKGYILIEIKNGSRNFDRKITINKMLFDYKQNVIAPLTKCEETKDKLTSKITSRENKLFLSYKKENPNASENELKIVEDFILYRKEIKDEIKTLLPIKSYLKALMELHKLGYKVKDCILKMKENEWKTIKVDYIHKEDKKADSNNSNENTAYAGGYR